MLLIGAPFLSLEHRRPAKHGSSDVQAILSSMHCQAMWPHPSLCVVVEQPGECVALSMVRLGALPGLPAVLLVHLCLCYQCDVVHVRDVVYAQ